MDTNSSGTKINDLMENITNNQLLLKNFIKNLKKDKVNIRNWRSQIYFNF